MRALGSVLSPSFSRKGLRLSRSSFESLAGLSVFSNLLLNSVFSLFSGLSPLSTKPSEYLRSVLGLSRSDDLSQYFPSGRAGFSPNLRSVFSLSGRSGRFHSPFSAFSLFSLPSLLSADLVLRGL